MKIPVHAPVPAPATHRFAVAVTILNYNSAGMTRHCVASILKETDPRLDLRVVVVDNASAPEENLANHAWGDPRVEFHPSRINLGFAGGHQFALQFVRARYYFLFNNDGYLCNDAIRILYDFMEGHPGAVLATGQCLDANGQVRASFNYEPSLARAVLGSGLLRRMHPENYPHRLIAYSHPIEVPMVTGSALFVRAEPFEALGGLDTHFFLYCEEEDLARSLRQRGGHVFFVPEARFRHIGEGASSGHPGLRQEFYISFLYYLRKHHSRPYVLAFRLFLLVKLLVQAFRGREPWTLFWFVACGAPERRSLRFSQRLS
ncbi:glycosyl transferase family 2 [mine drainage metagenome]|uniref:Glycosyl transferase family 2 n=1 Tax=mine drainage metagenome TaxID=410659 RepID=T1D149_9ZZZZ